MAARVIEVGCVPTGLVLSHVDCSPSSVVLTAADGGFRGDDVGKLISIPGGADLVATTFSLFDAKEIADTDVVLDEASGLVTKLIAHPHTGDPDPTKNEPFFSAGDVNKRIMVTGAGSGGDLVTTVAQFVDKTTLILEEPAAAAVTGRRMVLNAADRIGLDDYARADAENQTITLPDGRTVSDARIFKGQAALRSDTAKFSVNDLRQAVTLIGAGRHVTTIDEVEDRTTVRLHVAPTHEVTGGQADVWDGGSDCRPAFRELLNGLREGPDSVEAADIVFGPGVFDFTNDPDDHIPGSLDLFEVRNITLRGAGPGATVLRLRPDQHLPSDSHVLHLRRCRNVTIRDLTVNGAYLTMGAVNEQMHGIFLSEGCEDIIIERVNVFQTAGDGLRMLGIRDISATPPIDRPVRRVWVDNCRLVQNKRSGIAVQRNVERVWVRDCFIEMTRPSTDSCVDFEPSGDPDHGDQSPREFVFDSNVLVSGTPAAVVSISGFDPVHPARQVRFVNNTVTGGLVEGADAHDVTIAGNTIEAGERPRPVVRFRGSYEGLRIENNTLSSPLNDESEGIHVSALGGATPARVRVTGNDIDVGGIGIVLENVGSFVDIDHNRILGRHKERGVLTTLRADTVHQSLRVTDNTITNFAGTAIDVSRGSSTDTIVGLIITGNHLTITDDTPTAGLVGIGLRSDHGDQEWAEKPVIAGNSINQNIPIQIFKGPGVAVTTIAGNTGRVAIYEGDSDPGSPDHSPEGHIIAAPGSLFLQNNPEPATLYYKTNGTADTGWTQLELTPTS